MDKQFGDVLLNVGM